MFDVFRSAVAANIAKITQQEGVLVKVNPDKSYLFSEYLSAFTDPVERQHYNCNACRQFIHSYGKLALVHNGVLTSIWPTNLDGVFGDIGRLLNNKVITADVESYFYPTVHKIGIEHNYENTELGLLTWEHLHGVLPNALTLVPLRKVDEVNGKSIAIKNVFLRSLKTITIEACQDVLELITQNNLRRGLEYKNLVSGFLQHLQACQGKTEREVELYAWEHAHPALAIRNTVIGTLLVDISEGIPLDKAVATFEHKVDPTRFHRTSAPVTTSMKTRAVTLLKELGYENSLAMRHATMDDLHIGTCMYVHRPTAKANPLTTFVADVEPSKKDIDRAEPVSLNKLVEEIIPSGIDDVSLLLEPSHSNKLMNILIQQDRTSPSLFKWENPFSWCYVNGVTDSIEERVKHAGGRVAGELRVSLSWFNHTDYDLHVSVMDDKEHVFDTINYVNKVSRVLGGSLDVDMQYPRPTTNTPVENIIFPNKDKMVDGEYKVMVSNWTTRDTKNTHMVVEIKHATFNKFVHIPVVRESAKHIVAAFTYTKEYGITNFRTAYNCTDTEAAQQLWGLSTNKFHTVKLITYSPNYWSDGVGNEYLFFILEGAKTTDKVRGIFNEYLKSSLMEDRKALDLLGGMLDIEPTDEQLAGVGFSNTIPASVVLRVRKDNSFRLYRVTV